MGKTNVSAKPSASYYRYAIPGALILGGLVVFAAPAVGYLVALSIGISSQVLTLIAGYRLGQEHGPNGS